VRRSASGISGGFSTRTSHDLVTFRDLLPVNGAKLPDFNRVAHPNPLAWFGPESVTRFIRSAFIYEDVPNLIGKPPEVLFTGRTNCGKSTLIQSMTRTKGLVRTSSKPGSTQSLNFFLVGRRNLSPNKFVCIVDGPGYGGRGTEAQGRLFEEYVTNRETLKHIFILFNLGDPINRYDRAMLECLSDLLKNHPRGVKMQPVFTKLDKLARRNAPGKIIKARETLHNLAPDALEPWYLVRAGGKPSQWVGVEEMQRAALLGAGLSVPKPAKTVSAPPGIDTSRARTARGPLNAANT